MALFLLRSMMYTAIPPSMNVIIGRMYHILLDRPRGLSGTRGEGGGSATSCGASADSRVMSSQLPELFPDVLLVAVVNGAVVFEPTPDVCKPPRIAHLGLL